MNKPSFMANVGLVTSNFRAATASLIVGFIALVFCDFGQMIIPRLVGRSFDILAENQSDSLEAYITPIVLILFLALLVAVLRYLWRHLIYGFSRSLEKDLRRRLEERFLSLSMTWHQENSGGDIMALSTNDIEAVRLAVGFGLVSLVDAVVLGVSALGFMLSIDPFLCLLAFIPMPLITVLTAKFGSAIYKRVLEAQDIFGQMTEVVREQLSGFKVIRAMALERLSQAEVSSISRVYLNKNIHLALILGGFFPLMTLLTNMALALALYIGGRSTIMGNISPGDFVAFITYLALLSWPMLAMGITLGIVQSGMASLDRLARVLKAQEIDVHPLTADFPDPEGAFDIKFEKVSFAYPTRPDLVLKDLNLTFPAGQISALAGPTGSGKSTLAALLPALYEPSQGQILINNIPSTQWPLDRLRGLFGYVPQEGHVFTGTMRQNLAFGAPMATDQEIIKAAEAAAIPMDPEVFPLGLETMVGERGLTLSGGQRQRLALARALLVNPPFLILDDTLSAVDAAVEEEILARLAPIRQGRGTLIVSHRLTSLSKASNVAVLEEGRLEAFGDFSALTQGDGYLARIAELARLGVSQDPFLLRPKTRPEGRVKERQGAGPGPSRGPGGAK
ncbi:MAG: ABC transporter ATP-binding protein/permease [Deltaproteobacteria bacterium]|nr:ABC transporter ATP-binding protein/permease [Deltaproteobacteria bacterium]